LSFGSPQSIVSSSSAGYKAKKTNGSAVLATIGICAAILTLTPEKQSAEWVFTHVTDGSGWGSRVFSFLLGFLSVAWTMTDYDGTTQYDYP
jgi:hypothetical protein